MSLVVKLMIGGWATTLAMIGVCALNESGKLFNIRRRLASWMQPADATFVYDDDREQLGITRAD
jgi:hypothetical protein